MSLVYLPIIAAELNVSHNQVQAVIKLIDDGSTTPVSYTHLDVYKRQEYPRIIWIHSKVCNACVIIDV